MKILTFLQLRLCFIFQAIPKVHLTFSTAAGFCSLRRMVEFYVLILFWPSFDALIIIMNSFKKPLLK